MHNQAEHEDRLNTEGSDRLAHRLFINCGRALAQAVDEQALLQSVCNTLVNDCGFRLASFGYTESGFDHRVGHCRPLRTMGIGSKLSCLQ